MSISCKDIAESFKSFKVKAITQGSKGAVSVWNTSKVEYTYCVWDLAKEAKSLGKEYLIGHFEITEFVGKDARDCLYVVKDDTDYSSLIGTLCVFWNDDEDSLLDVLVSVTDNNLRFKSKQGSVWDHCRPLKFDEIKAIKEV